MNLKRNRISKLCILVLIVLVSICGLETGTAFATDDKQNKQMNDETRKERVSPAEAFHVQEGGLLDMYMPDKDPNFPYVVVPETIDGVTVTATSNDVFKDKGMKSIDFPDSVVSIGMQAFMGNSLEKVKLPANLSRIESETFAGNKNLTSIDIPESVTFIGSSAFRDCGLTNIYISDSVITIGTTAFSNNELTEVRLPSALKVIDSVTFCGNKKLKHIDIPESVTIIENDAFRDCGLESVKLPSRLSLIGKQAFMNNMIKSITIPGTLTSWADYAFANNALESVVIEEGVKKVGSDFMNASWFGSNMFNNISSITLPSTVESVGYYTFAESSLLYFDLPTSVKSLGDDCFLEQKVTMDYLVGKDTSTVKLPKEMTISKFKVSTNGVMIDSNRHELSVPTGVTEVSYSYKLGTFSGVERFLTGSLTLGKGLVKVRFLDYDGSILEEMDAAINETVVPTHTPHRDGYTFIGWDKSLDNITVSQDIRAVYKQVPKIIVNDMNIKVGDSFDPLKDIQAMDADGNEIKNIKVIENTVNTSKEGIYSVTVEATDQWSGKTKKQYKVMVEAKYIDKVLTDKESGIMIDGSFAGNAKVIVELIPISKSSLSENVRGKELINAFEVHVEGEYQGKLKIVFPLDKELDGTKIFIFHEKSDGTIEEFERIANNGFVEIMVDELSPFVLAKDKVQPPTIKPEDTPSNVPSDNVMTGDQTNIAVLTTLFVMTGLIAFVVKKKHNKN